MSEEKDASVVGNKRSSDDDGVDTEAERLSKKQRMGHIRTELKLLVPSRHAGAIIGKRGENIKRLRESYTASISVPDSTGPERLVIINGRDDHIFAVLSDIIRRLERAENEADVDCEIRILVHQSLAGRIIGKGGSKVKEIRQETAVEIKVYTECCPRSMERVAQLTGNLSGILNCLQMIFEVIDGVPIRGVNVPYNPSNFDEYMVEDYGGFADRRSINSGFSRNRGQAERALDREPGYTSYEGLAGFSGMPGFGRMGSGSGPFGPIAGLGALMGGGSQKTTTNQVSIPKNLAGAIIGKGGNRIREVQQETGTKIKLDDSSSDSDERIISITGTSDQIQYAQYLLQMMVKKHANTH